MIDQLARDGIAYVPFFPLGGFTPLQSADAVRGRGASGHDADAGCARLAHPARAEHPADPGTSSVEHLRENLAAANLELSPDMLSALDDIATGGARA